MEQLIRDKLENLKELEKTGKDSNYIKELSSLALLQITTGHHIEAERNYITCLKYFKIHNERLGEAAVLGVLGTLYFKKEDYQKSIDNYEEANEIYKELHQLKEQITCLIGIGNALLKLGKLDEACDTFLDCSTTCADNHDFYSLLDCLGNLINIHETQEKYDVVFELYLKSLETFKQLNDPKGIITSFFNLGILKKRVENHDDALTYFKKGTNQAIDSNYTELIIKGLGYVGESLFYIGNVKEAKDEFIKALRLAKKIKAQNAILQIKVLLNSFGLNEDEINKELEEYEKNHKI